MALKQTWVVLVKTGPLTYTAYGPYTKFKAAEGDAKTWGGSVEPMLPPGHGSCTPPVPYSPSKE